MAAEFPARIKALLTEWARAQAEYADGTPMQKDALQALAWIEANPGSVADGIQSATNREHEYLVMKSSDLIAAGLTEAELDQLQEISKKVDQCRRDAGLPDLETVVVEKGWPEYEPTWAAIEKRVVATT